MANYSPLSILKKSIYIYKVKLPSILKPLCFIMLFLTMSIDIVGIQYFEFSDNLEVLEADAEKECEKDKKEAEKKLISDAEANEDLWSNPYGRHNFSNADQDRDPVYLRVFDPPPELI